MKGIIYSTSTVFLRSAETHLILKISLWDEIRIPAFIEFLKVR